MTFSSANDFTGRMVTSSSARFRSTEGLGAGAYGDPQTCDVLGNPPRRMASSPRISIQPPRLRVVFPRRHRIRRGDIDRTNMRVSRDVGDGLDEEGHSNRDCRKPRQRRRLSGNPEGALCGREFHSQAKEALRRPTVPRPVRRRPPRSRCARRPHPARHRARRRPRRWPGTPPRGRSPRAHRLHRPGCPA
jgi:hypothetical protein